MIPAENGTPSNYRLFTEYYLHCSKTKNNSYAEIIVLLVDFMLIFTISLYFVNFI